MNTILHKVYKSEAYRTLCTKCDKACGRCSWSAFGIPVKGWVAEQTKINVNHARDEVSIDSFNVLECPNFSIDKERHTPTIRTDRVMTLIYAILIRAISDYASYQIKLKKSAHPTRYLLQSINEVERYLNDPMTADMLHACGFDLDPMLIINAVKADPLGVIERLRISYGVTEDEPKKIGRPRSNCWDNPRLPIRNAERTQKGMK